MGLVGPWGSGKTITIGFIEDELRKRDEGWEVRRFTPWAAHEPDGLVSEFFATLATASDGGESQKLQERILGLSRIATPALKFIPFFGTPTSEMFERALEHATLSKPWSDQFEQVSKELAALRKRILIVADDIDRLHPDELMTLFKVVRLLGRFPGVTYLLAYDDESVMAMIEKSGHADSTARRAQQYLEKIVQYPVPLPAVQRYHIERSFEQGINDILEDMSRSWPEEDEDRFIAPLHSAIFEDLTTLRSLERYLAQVRLTMALLPDEEVNTFDLLMLTYLRLFFPREHQRLPRLREELTGTGLDQFGAFSHGTDETYDWDKEFESVPPDRTRQFFDVLSATFPVVSQHGYGPDPAESASMRRACNRHYFDRYFASAVPEDDIADRAIDDALAEIRSGSRGDALAEFLEKATNDDPRVQSNTLSKAHHYWKRESEHATWPLICFLAELAGSVSRRFAATGSPASRVHMWMDDAFAAIEDDAIPEDASRQLLQLGLEHLALLKTIDHTDPDRASAAFKKMGRDAAASSIDVLISHFSEQDSANPTAPVELLSEYIFDWAMGDEARKRVLQSIHAGKFTIEDVASRYVGFDVARQQISGMSMLRFNKWKLPLDPPDIADGQEPDLEDGSWSGRRRYAAHELGKKLSEARGANSDAESR